MAYMFKENAILLPKEVVGIYCFSTPFLLNKAQQRFQVAPGPTRSLGHLGLVF